MKFITLAALAVIAPLLISQAAAELTHADIMAEYGKHAGTRSLSPKQETYGHGFEKRAAKTPYTVGNFTYGKTKVRGVNLGGWLVLEPWITPSIFEATGDSKIVDEFTYGKKYGSKEASKRLQNHWATWITEKDFKSIASFGLNHVRIPIGHWAYDIQGDEQYAQGQLPYLKQAIVWARKYGIKVMVDIHGAPGSQNGFDNSGRAGTANWPNKASNVDRTKAVLAQLSKDLAGDLDTVTAIAVLNEPAGFLGEKLLTTARKYHDDAYGIVRKVNKGALVTYSDAFQPSSYWKNYQTSSAYKGISMDLHYYTLFSDDELRFSKSQRLQAACDKGSDVKQYQQLAVIGEWSPAVTDCAKWLHGRNTPANYDTRLGLGSCKDKTGNGKNFSQDYKDYLRAHWEAQTTSWETNGDGWIQWTWKTEQAADWAYHSGVIGGWIPRNPAERKFKNPC